MLGEQIAAPLHLEEAAGRYAPWTGIRSKESNLEARRVEDIALDVLGAGQGASASLRGI